MGTCPKCGKEINFLYIQEEGTKLYTVSLDGDGELIFEEYDYETYTRDAFVCPKCNEPLGEADEEAKSILSNKIEKVEES